MKKFLSLLLAVSLAFSCFSVVSFAEEMDEDSMRPDCVAQVIDPIINDLNTAFADSINQVGYKSVEAVAKTGNITDFEGFIEANKNDTMLGVTIENLYTEDREAFLWYNFRVPLVTGADHGTSSCKFKEMYDECAEVLLGNRVEYENKAADAALFEKITEVKVDLGQKQKHYNYYFTLERSEVALVKANMNLYLKRVITNYWGGGKFYTNDNIVKLTNFIGTLINPDFTLLPEYDEDGNKYRPIKDNVAIDEEDFFGKIVELSGLGALIDSNWCKQPSVNFLPLMKILGVNLDMLLTREKEEGYYAATRLLTDMFSSFFAAPLTFILDVLWAFSKGYAISYRDAFMSLFTIRYAQFGNQYTEEALMNLTSVLNFLSDAVDSVMNKLNGSPLYDNIAFATLPIAKLAGSESIDEFFLMLLCYLDINRVYMAPAKRIDVNRDGVIDENTEVFRRTENDIALENIWINFNKAAGATLTQAEMTTVKGFFDNFLCGGLTMKVLHKDMLEDITNVNMGQLGNDFMTALKNSIASLLKKIVDAIDNFVRLILGEKDPFERL